MMALDLFQQLHALGVMLTPYPDGTLRYKAPQGVLTPALVDRMREHNRSSMPWSRPSRNAPA